MADATTVGKALAKAADATAARSAISAVARDFVTFSAADRGAGQSKTAAENSTAIAQTITDATSAATFLRGGVVIALPPGRLKVSSTINLTASCQDLRGAGWSNPTDGQPASGTILKWEGGNAPMIQIQGSRGLRLDSLMLVGNSDPAKRPTALVRCYVASGDTLKNGMIHINRCSFGKLSGLGFGVADIVADNGILFDGAVNTQNDTSWISHCRFDGCAVGIQTTATQSVLHHVQDSYFWNCGTAVKTVSQMRLDNIYCAFSTVRDIEISSSARVELNEFASECAKQFALISGSGSSLIVRGGYWQISSYTQADRRAIDNQDDARTVIRLSNFDFTANSDYAASLASKPIIRCRPASNSALGQKILELDNVRYRVQQPYTGFDEAMLEVSPPSGQNSSVTLYGNVQPPTAGATSGNSQNEGRQRWFFNTLRNGAAPNLQLDDRLSAVIADSSPSTSTTFSGTKITTELATKVASSAVGDADTDFVATFEAALL